MTLNLYDAKTQLSSLVEMAAAGEEIIIAKNGKPMAKLVAFKDAIKRKPGRLKGKSLDVERLRRADDERRAGGI